MKSCFTKGQIIEVLLNLHVTKQSTSHTLNDLSCFKIEDNVLCTSAQILHRNNVETRPIASKNRCKLYPPERKLTKAILTLLNLEGEAQGEI